MKDVSDYLEGAQSVTLPASDIARIKRGVESIKHLLAAAIKKNGGEIRFSSHDHPNPGEPIKFIATTDPASGETILRLTQPVMVQPGTDISLH